MNKLLLGAVALVVAVPVMAQMQPPVAPPTITPRADVTQTRDQVVAKVRDHFARMDANRDGFVAGDEMQAMRGQHQGMKRQMGERRGRGGDRMAMANPGAAFDRLDANRDGAISRDEFAKSHEMRKGRRIAMHGQPGAPGAPGAMQHDGQRGMMKMHRMGGMGRMGGGGMMKMADIDRDGRVSLQEATTKALERFDRVDANRDGRITPDERRHNRDQRQQMRAPKAG